MVKWSNLYTLFIWGTHNTTLFSYLPPRCNYYLLYTSIKKRTKSFSWGFSSLTELTHAKDHRSIPRNKWTNKQTKVNKPSKAKSQNKLIKILHVLGWTSPLLQGWSYEVENLGKHLKSTMKSGLGVLSIRHCFKHYFINFT